MHACIHTYTHTHIHTHIHTYTHTHIHTHTYTYMHYISYIKLRLTRMFVPSDQIEVVLVQGLAQLRTHMLGGNQIRSTPTDARAWHSCRHSCLQLSQALHQPICWRSRPYRTTQALVAKLEPKQDVDHHSCSPGPGEAEDAHAGWEPDQKHPNRCQGLAQPQTLTLAARVSAVEPGPASANMLTQQTLQDYTSSGA